MPKDLTDLAKDIEGVFKKYYEGRPGIAVAFTFYGEVHWVTNVSRDDGIKLFQETANKMKSQLN